MAVPVVRLDDYAATNGIERIDVLKIDVEGADAWVLEGARGLLQEKRIGTVFFEEEASHLARLGIRPGTCSEVLRQAGYDVRPLAPDEFVATPHL